METTALSARDRFPSYTNRAALKAATGIDAPAFNPAWPIKQWADPAAKDDPFASYQVWNGSLETPWPLVSLVLSGAEAAAYNLPGTVVYPAYAIPPSAATKTLHFGSFSGQPVPLDPMADLPNLSLRSDADALAAACGATVAEWVSLYTYNWGAEQRRFWLLQYKNLAPGAQGPFAGQVLADMNAKGIGAPGHWSASQLALGQLQWVPETVDDGSGAHPIMEVPKAPLAGEILVAQPIGIMFASPVWQVPGTVQVPSAAPSGDTDLARDTNAKVTAIAKAVGV